MAYQGRRELHSPPLTHSLVSSLGRFKRKTALLYLSQLAKLRQKRVIGHPMQIKGTFYRFITSGSAPLAVGEAVSVGHLVNRTPRGTTGPSRFALCPLVGIVSRFSLLPRALYLVKRPDELVQRALCTFTVLWTADFGFARKGWVTETV